MKLIIAAVWCLASVAVQAQTFTVIPGGPSQGTFGECIGRVLGDRDECEAKILARQEAANNATYYAQRAIAQRRAEGWITDAQIARLYAKGMTTFQVSERIEERIAQYENSQKH